VPSVSQEHAAPLLEEQAQRREAERPFAGVQDIARRMRVHAVAFAREDAQAPRASVSSDFFEPVARAEPSGFGVILSATQVLTHASALDGRSSVRLITPAGERAEARVTAYEASTGLVLLETAIADGAAPAMAVAPPEAGALTVAAAGWNGREMAMPVFVSSVADDRYTLGTTGHSLLPGQPLYSMDGALLALVVANGRDAYGLPVRDAAARLIARAASGDRRGATGVSFQKPEGSLTRIFGETGVVITEVLPGGPADGAGIEPGDVLTAIGGLPVATVEDASRLLRAIPPTTVASLQMRRAGRARTVEITPAAAYEVAAIARGRADVATARPEARLLFQAPVLAAAGIPPSAIVVSVDGRALDSRDAIQQVLTRARGPVPVLLRHGDVQFFAAVERPR
jgi:S1-C subfamily serine protease